MSFPFKGTSSCPSVPIDSPSTTPYMGSGLSAQPASSGGASAMLSINQACQCTVPCCGGGTGPSGGSGPPGGSGPGGGFNPRGVPKSG